MLMNVRSAADIQRSVMNIGNVPRARRLVVEKGSIRLEGESPQPFPTELDRKIFSAEKAIAMVTQIPPALKHDAAPGPDPKNRRMDGASPAQHHPPDQRSALVKKATPAKPTIQHAGRIEGSSGAKGKTKAQKSSPLSHQPQSPSWSSIPGGLPEWMKYLPKAESTSESPAIP
jgi:hypothetical protein